MFCHKCGISNSESNKYCSECGTKINQVLDNVTQLSIEPTKEKSFKNRYSGAEIFVLILSITSFITGFIFMISAISYENSAYAIETRSDFIKSFEMIMIFATFILGIAFVIPVKSNRRLSSSIFTRISATLFFFAFALFVLSRIIYN